MTQPLHEARTPTRAQMFYLMDVACVGWLSEVGQRRRHFRRACLAAGWIERSFRGAYGVYLTEAGKALLGVGAAYPTNVVKHMLAASCEAINEGRAP
jgi:hypothetical protein